MAVAIVEADLSHEVCVSNLISGEKSLRIALSSIQYTRLAKSVFLGTPNLEVSSQKLAKLLTHVYPYEGATDGLLALCLKDAIDAYIAASEVSEDVFAMADAFLLALINKGAHLVEFDVYGLGANETTARWPVLQSPLIDWPRKRGFQALRFEPKTDVTDDDLAGARLMLAGQVLVMHDAVRVANLLV